MGRTAAWFFNFQGYGYGYGYGYEYGYATGAPRCDHITIDGWTGLDWKRWSSVPTQGIGTRCAGSIFNLRCKYRVVWSK